MLAIRLSDEDRGLLDELVRRKADQLAGEGVEVTAALVLRGLLRQAATDAGIIVKSSVENGHKSKGKGKR